ncbi:MAG: hypothetical protein IJC50_04460 [Clostridia bacterium]|nr:hypothetical protein [Clostridia bacterium]
MDSTKNSVPYCMDRGTKTCKSIVRCLYLLKVVCTALLFLEMYSLIFVAFPFIIGTPIYIFAGVTFEMIPPACAIVGIVLLFVWILVLPFFMFWKSEKLFFIGNIILTVLNLADVLCFISIAVISSELAFIIGSVFDAATIAVSAVWIFKTSRKEVEQK